MARQLKNSEEGSGGVSPESQEEVMQVADFGSNAALTDELESQSESSESTTSTLDLVAIARPEVRSEEEGEQKLDELLELDGAQLERELNNLDIDSMVNHLPSGRHSDLAALSERCTNPEHRMLLWQGGFIGEAEERTEGLDNADAIVSGDIDETDRQIEQLQAIMDGNEAILRADFDYTEELQADQDAYHMMLVDRMIARQEHELDVEVEHDVSLDSTDSDVPDSDRNHQYNEDTRFSHEELDRIDVNMDRLPEEHLDGLESVRAITREQIAAETNTEEDEAPLGHYDPDGRDNRREIVMVTDRMWDSDGDSTNRGRMDNETSQLGGHLDVGGERDPEFHGRDPVTTFDEVLIHEIGHNVDRFSGDEFADIIRELAGWEKLSLAELREELEASGLDDAEIEQVIAGLEDSRGDNHGRRNTERLDGQTYLVDPYARDDEDDQYLRRDSDVIPGESGSSAEGHRHDVEPGDRYNYARTAPGEHFAELYSNMVHDPEAVHEDFVLAPEARLEAAEAALERAREQFEALPDSASPQEREDAECLVAQREGQVADREAQFASMSEQFETMRSGVFGVTPEVRDVALEEIRALADQAGDDAASYVDAFEDELEQVGTMEQLENLREMYEGLIELSG